MERYKIIMDWTTVFKMFTSLVLPWIVFAFSVYKWIIQPIQDRKKSFRSKLIDLEKSFTYCTSLSKQIMQSVNISTSQLKEFRLSIDDAELQFDLLRAHFPLEIRVNGSTHLKYMRGNLDAFETQSNEDSTRPKYGPEQKVNGNLSVKVAFDLVVSDSKEGQNFLKYITGLLSDKELMNQVLKQR